MLFENFSFICSLSINPQLLVKFYLQGIEKLLILIPYGQSFIFLNKKQS